MPIESWIVPEETADLAAHAAAMIDAALVGTGLAREAYWAAVRKGYNTPYNDPPPRKRAVPAQPDAVVSAPVVTEVETVSVPVAVIAARAVEARAS